MAISPNQQGGNSYPQEPANSGTAPEGNWDYTYRSLLPKLEGQLNKLTPEGKALVNKYLQAPSAGFDTPEHKAARAALMKQLGISDAEAQGFIRAYRNATILGPNQRYNEVNPMAGADGIQDRAAYASDAEYQDALMKNLGLGWMAAKDAEAEAARIAEEEAARAQGIRAGIENFAKEMLGDVSPNDPVMRQLLSAGTDAAQAQAGSAGIDARSGLAGTQAASLGQVNALPYLQQRKSLGLQAMQTVGNLDLGYQQLQSAEAQYAQNRADLLAGENWKAGLANRQEPFGMIGTVAGGIIGAYAGGPQGAMAGAQIGGAGGRSLGAMNYESAPNYSTYRPTTTWMTGKPRNSGGGGGTGF